MCGLTPGTLILSSYLMWIFFTDTCRLLIILVMRDEISPSDCGESASFVVSARRMMTYVQLLALGDVRLPPDV